jgi:murein DD-endopeptidase MepM/ murein hydrolase activator NlpD
LEAGMVGWLAAPALLLRAAAIGLPLAAGFLVVTALSCAVIEHDGWRVTLALAACLGLPLLFRWRVGVWQRRRGRKSAPLGRGVYLALGNLVIAGTLAFGFADDVGRALRRHGDWFLGDRNGAVARGLRAGIGFAALHLETFDPRPELAPVVIPAPGPVPVRPPELPPEAPWVPPEPPPPVVAHWFHPLAGPERALPARADRRFGARRPPPRPAECELGHCGVDLGSTVGEPVFAVFDGVVDKVQRDPDADPRAGIGVILSHNEGTVRSRYLHLDSIVPELRPGDAVKGGQLIGRLGRTGILHSGPHLHFGLSLREGSRDVYLDPEPYLRSWKLPDVEAALEPVLTRSGMMERWPRAARSASSSPARVRPWEPPMGAARPPMLAWRPTPAFRTRRPTTRRQPTRRPRMRPPTGRRPTRTASAGPTSASSGSTPGSTAAC